MKVFTLLFKVFALLNSFLWRIIYFNKLTLVFPTLIFEKSPFELFYGCHVKFGKKTVLSKYSEVVCKGELTVGENFSLNKYSRIVSHECINIGSNVIIAQFVSILDHDHKYEILQGKLSFEGYISKPIIIGDNVWIGDKVTICKGVKIGSNVIIGANSVVTKDIEDNCIAGGVPCKKIRSI